MTASENIPFHFSKPGEVTVSADPEWPRQGVGSWLAAPSCRRDLPVPRWVAGEHLLKNRTRERFRRVRWVEYPTVTYYLLPDARIVDQALVIAQDGTVYSETVPHQLLHGATDRYGPDGQRRATSDPDRTRTLTGTTLVLPVTSPSKSHFLFEAFASFLDTNVAVDHVVITSATQLGVADLIRLAMGERAQIHFRPQTEWNSVWRCERAIVPAYRFALHPRMAGSVERILAGVPHASSKPAERIYVSRRDAWTYRMMLNEDLVEELLREMGFKVLLLAQMPEAELLDAFRTARIVIGPQGAGLYNAIFSNSGTIVVALGAPNYLRSIFEQCVAAAGLRHGYVFGPDFLSFESSQAGGNNDFVVDLDSVRAVVESAIAVDAGRP